MRDESRMRTPAALQADYDDLIGRSGAVAFAEVGAWRGASRIVAVARRAEERLRAGTPADRRADPQLGDRVLQSVMKSAVAGSARFQPLGTAPGSSPESAAGRLLGRIRTRRERLQGVEGRHCCGLVSSGLGGSVPLLEAVSVAWAGPQYRLLLEPDPWSVRRFVLHHEGKHAEHYLAPELRARRGLRAFPNEPSDLTYEEENEKEIGADLHGLAASAAETGISVAAEIADFRALSFALGARSGSVQGTGLLHYWTVSAIDAARPALDAYAAGASPRLVDIGDALDEAGRREAHRSHIFDRRRASEAFREAAAESRGAGVMEFLERAALAPPARRYAERCMEAAERMLDLGFCAAFEAARFEMRPAAAPPGVERTEIFCNGTSLMSTDWTGGRDAVSAAQLLAVVQGYRLDTLADRVARCRELGLHNFKSSAYAAEIADMSEDTVALMDRFMGDVNAREAFRRVGGRIDAAVGAAAWPRKAAAPEPEVAAAFR